MNRFPNKKNMPSGYSKKDLSIKPLEQSETIPSSWYTDPNFLEVDMQCVFSQTWQYAGHVTQVLHRGDYVLTTVGGNPAIIIRGKDDIVRAFFNVCRHRGGPLAVEESGNCNILQCKYHGWTYLLDGSLRGTPKFDRTELFDRKDYGLVPVRLEAWEGFLFLNLSTDKFPLSTIMKGIPERIAPHSLTNKKFYRRIEYVVNCNWKVYVDNYLEGYHLPFVHSKLCNLLDYQKYVKEKYENYSLQFSPFTGKENVYTSGEGEAFYYFVFPNFMMNFLPGRVQTNLVLPIEHNRCKVIFDYYFDDVDSPEALRKIEDDISYIFSKQKTAYEICELVQRGLNS